MKTLKKPALLLFVATSTFGCASDAPLERSKTGVAIGAVTGAILGHQIDHDEGSLVGGVLGAIAGAAVGSYMDEQQRALEEELRAEREAEQIEIRRLADNSLQLNVRNEVSFAVNSALVSADFYDSLNKMASVLENYAETAIHVIGHTDSSGAASYNQSLSKKRARSVSRYLEDQGVLPQRLRPIGRGEDYPVADNATAAGRSKNRRVEIILKPIVQGRERRAFRAPPASS